MRTIPLVALSSVSKVAMPPRPPPHPIPSSFGRSLNNLIFFILKLLKFAATNFSSKWLHQQKLNNKNSFYCPLLFVNSMPVITSLCLTWTIYNPKPILSIAINANLLDLTNIAFLSLRTLFFLGIFPFASNAQTSSTATSDNITLYGNISTLNSHTVSRLDLCDVQA